MLRADELELARRLLYEVYYEDLGWDPQLPNPSGLFANHQHARFEDDLDHDAIWVGVFDRRQTLVAIARIIDRQRVGQLEIERYTELPEPLVGDRPSVEANRIAVRRSHRSTLTLGLLHSLCESCARELGALRSIAAPSIKIARGAGEIYGWNFTDITFRYTAKDPDEVHVMYCELDEPNLLPTAGRLIKRRIERLLRPLTGRPTNRHGESARRRAPSMGTT